MQKGKRKERLVRDSENTEEKKNSVQGAQELKCYYSILTIVPDVQRQKHNDNLNVYTKYFMAYISDASYATLLL